MLCFRIEQNTPEGFAAIANVHELGAPEVERSVDPVHRRHILSALKSSPLLDEIRHPSVAIHHAVPDGVEIRLGDPDNPIGIRDFLETTQRPCDVRRLPRWRRKASPITRATWLTS